MAVKQLTPDQIRNIVANSKLAAMGYPAPPQFGSLGFLEKETRCLISGYWDIEFDPTTKEYSGKRHWKKVSTGACYSPTSIKVEGVPCCSAHALMMLNALAIDFRFKVADCAADSNARCDGDGDINCLLGNPTYCEKRGCRLEHETT